MTDPKRLLDGETSELGASLLRAGRREEAPTAVKERMLLVLGAGIGAAGAEGAIGGKLGTMSALSGVSKKAFVAKLVVSSVAAVGIGSGVLLTQGGGPPPPPSEAPSIAMPSAHSAARGAVPVPAPAPEPAREPAPTFAPAREPAPTFAPAPAPEPGPAPGMAMPPSRLPSNEPSAPPPATLGAPLRARPRVPDSPSPRDPAPASPATVVRGGELPPPEPVERMQPPLPLHAGGADAPAEPSRRAPRAELDREVALLDEAKFALRRGDARGAAAALDRYAERFPRGALAPEAALLKVELLLRQGRLSDARALARAELDARPHGPHARRFRDVLSPGQPASPHVPRDAP
jgi:hypothetical protein